MAKAIPLPSLARLREVFCYPPPTGQLYWLKSRPNALALDEAGTVDRGYMVVKVDYKKYRLHRIVWAMRHGREIPEGYEVDHKDRNPLNNHIDNLRLATPSENQHNRAKSKNSTSGYKGVSWHKSEKKYYVQIKLNYKQYHLGSYDTAEQAALAYNEAAKRLHGEFAYQNEIPDPHKKNAPTGQRCIFELLDI